MKRRLTAMLLSVAMVFSLLAFPAGAAESDAETSSKLSYEDFTDLDDSTSWYYEGVSYVIEEGIMNGTGGTLFSPDGTCTRSMIVTILYRLAGSPAVTGSSGFSDVEDGQWYTDAIIWAEKKGITTGTGDGTFGVSGTLTREQFATFMYRYAEYQGYDTSESIDLDSEFPDYEDVDSWAEEAMSWAVAAELITGSVKNGVTVLAPTDSCTRSMAAVIIYRFEVDEDDNVVDSGTCDDGLTWVLYNDGLLEISGTGDMDDYVIADLLSGGVVEVLPPWYDYRESITEVIINEGVTSIGKYAFMGCQNLESVTMPDSLKSIGARAFASCYNLTSVTIPDSVTEIGMCAFQRCYDLTSVTIPGSVTNMGSRIFYLCTSLTNVTLEDGLTSISSEMFYCCTSLTSITIPDSVTSIGDYSFAFCESLESVTIPDSVTSIDYHAFYECTSLTDVYYSGTKEDWEAIDFDDEDDNECLTDATIHYSSTGPEE